MKTTPSVTPAYLVYHNNQVDAPTRTFSHHADLLTARKAAMTLAESLFGSQVSYAEQDEVEVYLVETTSADDPAPTTIARILQKRPTGYLPDWSVAPEPDSQPAKEIREHYQHVLLELQDEFAYYRKQNHPEGFGSFTIKAKLPQEPAPTSQVNVLFDAMGYAMAAISLANDIYGFTFSVVYYSPDESVEVLPIVD